MRAGSFCSRLIKQPLMIIKIHVVNYFSECFVAHLATKIYYQGLLLILLFFKKCCKVCRFMSDNTLMSSNFNLRDKYLFFFPPIAFWYMRNHMCLECGLIRSTVPNLLLILPGKLIIWLLLSIVWRSTLVVRLWGLRLWASIAVRQCLIIMSRVVWIILDSMVKFRIFIPHFLIWRVLVLDVLLATH